MRISRDCCANFVADFRTTFVRKSHECRENFHVSPTRRELVAKDFNMFKNFMRILSPKYFARLSCDGRATFVRVFRTCRRKILANLQCEIFATLVRMSCDCDGLATVLRKHAKTSRLSGERIKLSDIRKNVVRHSHECRATVVRIKMKISYIRGKVVRHSYECRATIVRQSRDYRATAARYIFKIIPKFANLSHKCLFNETAT